MVPSLKSEVILPDVVGSMLHAVVKLEPDEWSLSVSSIVSADAATIPPSRRLAHQRDQSPVLVGLLPDESVNGVEIKVPSLAWLELLLLTDLDAEALAGSEGAGTLIWYMHKIGSHGPWHGRRASCGREPASLR